MNSKPARPAAGTNNSDTQGTNRLGMGYVLMAALLAVMMLGGTIPIPLYVLYEARIGFDPFTITIIFAIYVIGTLVALLFFGGLSDHIGRKRVLVGAILLAAASTGFFLAATNVPVLLVARVLSGFAVGLATGTATAAIAELHPRGDHRAAAVVAAGVNMTGLGLGPLLAGVLAEYAPAPVHTVFWVYLGITALALIGLAAVPETAVLRDGVVSLRPNIGIPGPMRGVMAGATLGIFSAFTLLGLFSSLVPSFLRGTLGLHNLAVIGAVSFLIFVTGAISQAVFSHLPGRRSVGSGLGLLLVGLAGLEAALFTEALWLFLIGTVVSGAAVGLVFRGGLGEINRLVDPGRRAAVISTFFMTAYLGMTVPVVVIGLLSRVVRLVAASALVAGGVAVIGLVALVVVLRTFGARTALAPTAPSVRHPSAGSTTPADSWCCPQTTAGTTTQSGARPSAED
ncbi:MFS transporter [Streptomyces spinoverrucosus]|uniref:MFS transporter n=1 Tax=Streptomyces spinoverrucosus TaxID=284043 RepID=A0A4Y3VAX2_9ACTN|nr:MFS transporter [Streptomyces spinoverrucosus]GEC03238.1 MFS transporter [Streptomyces spinoverrucosus]GHB37200.1 MFS transporter [Streptomyces spinoverrucosus]